MRRSSRVGWWCLVLILCASCAVLERRGGREREILSATPEMQEQFRQAERLYFKKTYPQATAAYQEYVQAHPLNTLTGKAYYRLGEISLTLGQHEDAARFYQKALVNGPRSEWAQESLYKQAIAYYKQTKYDKVFKVLDRLDWNNLGQRLAVRGGSLRVAAAQHQGDRELERIKGVLEVYEASYLAGSPVASTRDLNWLVSPEQAKEELEAWNQQEDRDGKLWASLAPRFEGRAVGAFVLFKTAKSYNAAGDYPKAFEWIRKFVSFYPKSEMMPEARQLYADLEKRVGPVASPVGEGSVSSGATVGVLLPLSGKYATYGESVLHGLECAAGIFEPCHVDGTSLRLEIRDTQGSPTVAAHQMNDLAQDPSVVGVIGPLPQVEVDALVPIAEQNQLPMIALSQREDVAKQGAMVFRNFLTVRDQVATVVHYACKRKKLKRLGIFYPRGAEEFATNFTQEVEACGGKVVASRTYVPGRESYVEDLTALKSAGNFQALFIPDVYRNVLKIIPSLEFLKWSDVQLLGAAGWHHPDLAEAGVALEGAVFVDGFFAESDEFGIRDFTRMMMDAYGNTPTLLEAYAYDTLRLMARELGAGQSSTRLQLHERLSQVRNFSGVTGNISFDSEGDARRELFLLKVEGGQIREVH